MSCRQNLIGNKYGRLLVVDRADDYVYPNGKHRTQWLCKCDCGNMVVVENTNLKRGNSKSCGCLNSELRLTRSVTHNGRYDRLYGVWTNMKARCNNANNRMYNDYGGRGIKLCDEWNSSYESFREWAVANGYDETADTSKCTIDRIDVNGDYEPGNCRWTNAKVQANNRRNTIMITYGGVTRSLSKWADTIGIKYHTLFARIYKLGWPIEKALCT